jgi:hypothetical protein
VPPPRPLQDDSILRLAEIVRRVGAKVMAPRSSGPDLEFSHGGARYAVELKISPDNRRPVLEGLIAAALLQARRHAAQRGAEALPVLAVNKITEAGLRAIEDFMSAEAPGSPWGMIDASNRWAFRGVSWLTDNLRPADSTSAGRRLRDPFSDLGQWLSKVLLARSLPPELMCAPRLPIPNARRLAQVARVSAPTAAEWVRSLRSEGFLDERRGELRIVRVREFLARWRAAVQQRPPKRIPARFTLPEGDPDLQIRKALERYPFRSGVSASQAAEGAPIIWDGAPRACLVMFDAALSLGVHHVVGAPVHLALEHVDAESLSRFGLRVSEARDAHVHVLEPRMPESLFRAAVLGRPETGFEVPCCDILQCWLDVADHPVRGHELADLIERAILQTVLRA